MEEKARSSQERNTDRVIVADFFFPTRSIGTTVPGPIFFLQVGHNFIFYGSKANIDHQRMQKSEVKPKNLSFFFGLRSLHKNCHR